MPYIFSFGLNIKILHMYENDEIREMYFSPLLVPMFSIFGCVCDNRIKDIMSKYTYPSFHWKFDGTVGSLKTNSMYSVGFYGTTRRPGGKGKI